MNRYKLFTVLLILLAAVICHAQIYEQIDKKGNIIYSDTPLNDSAKKMDLPESYQTPPPANASNASISTDKVPKKIELPNTSQPYQSFLIASPKNEDTIQNQPVIPIEIKIEPDLREGDSIQLMLDGNPSGPPTASTHLELANVDRGSHQLSAVVIGQNQEILNQSSPVTIYVHHASINSIQRTQGTAPTAVPAP